MSENKLVICVAAGLGFCAGLMAAPAIMLAAFSLFGG